MINIYGTLAVASTQTVCMIKYGLRVENLAAVSEAAAAVAADLL